MSQVKCPLCGWDALSAREPGRDAALFDCHLCGRYVISSGLFDTLARALDEQDKKLLPYLRAHTRQATEAGETATVAADNWRDLARGHIVRRQRKWEC